MACTDATMIVVTAKRGCHLKGTTCMPLKFKAPMVAVHSISKKVNIPPYITNGFPKNKVSAILWIIYIFYSTIILPSMEGWTAQE